MSKKIPDPSRQVICYICKIPFHKTKNRRCGYYGIPDEPVVVATQCGHVFHRECFEEKGLLLSPRVKSKHEKEFLVKISCPSCEKPLPLSSNSRTTCFDLFFDEGDNSEYLKLKDANQELEMEKVMLANENQKLKEEKAAVEKEGNIQLNEMKSKVLEIREFLKKRQNLTGKNKPYLMEETKLVEDKQGLVADLCNILTEADRLRTENSELRKRMITAEIKLTLVTNADRLEEKFGDLNWCDITSTFQKELIRKLQISGNAFMNFDKILPINSNGLMRLIKAGEKDESLMQKIIEDYLEEKMHWNGKIIWADLDSSLKMFLTSKLRESSQMESLEIVHVPLSSKILVHLIRDTENNPNLLGDIVTKYVVDKVGGSSLLKNLCIKAALVELVNGQIVGCLKEQILDRENLDKLVELGMLMKTENEFEAPYKFVHESVKQCIIGIMMSKMEKIKVSRINVFKLFHGGYMSADPLGVYFADYMNEVEQSDLTKFMEFGFSDDTFEVLLILTVMKLPSLKIVIAILNQWEHGKLMEVEFSRKLPQGNNVTLTLLHAAAIRGDLERVKCLLYEFEFSKELCNPKFQGLILACVENTKECREEDIQQRKEIIKELVKLNGDLVKCDSPNPGLHVNDNLIKFMIEIGADLWIPLVATQ